MSATAAVRHGRRAAESLMIDTCTVSRAERDEGGQIVRDPMTGEPVRVEVYAGQCKVGGDSPYEQSPEAGSHLFVVQRFILHLPTAAGPFAADDHVVIDSCEKQPHLVGKEFRIAGPDLRSWQTAQRMFVEGVVA